MNLVNYHNELDNLLNDITIPDDVIRCNHLRCHKVSHRKAVQGLHDDIVRCCVLASKRAVPMSKPNSSSKIIPGWNENIAPKLESSLYWHEQWKLAGEPHEGELATIHRNTRAQYHLAIKKAEKDADKTRAVKMADARAVKMADAMIDNKSRDFWSEVKRVRSTKISHPSSMDTISGNDNIANHLSEKFSEIYNKVSYDGIIDQNIENCVHGQCYSNHNITVKSVSSATSKLKSAKSDGHSLFSSDHVIHGTHKLKVLLGLMYSSALTHGCLPNHLAKSVIIPIPKDTHKSLNTSTNYRGIALASPLAKMMELILMDEHSHVLQTCDLQFGFKPGTSTTQCTMVVDEIIKYYTSRGSDCHVMMLDCSKAFDLVEYIKLFRLLMDRNMCPVSMRLLLEMHLKQSICVKWLDSMSKTFTASNGVKQGGVLSPVLFTVYADILLTRLKNRGVGCHIGHHFAGEYRMQTI